VNRIIIAISFCFFPIGAGATDTLHLSTGQLSIPQVIVGNTKYFDLIAPLGSLISGGDLTSMLATTNLNLRPDTFKKLIRNCQTLCSEF
jgi:hypothetical protein